MAGCRAEELWARWPGAGLRPGPSGGAGVGVGRWARDGAGRRREVRGGVAGRWELLLLRRACLALRGTMGVLAFPESMPASL